MIVSFSLKSVLGIMKESKLSFGIVGEFFYVDADLIYAELKDFVTSNKF